MARDSLYPVSVKAGKPILGMLPTGWQKLSLEKCLNIEARKAYIQDNQEYDLVTVKRSRGGVIRREHLKGKDISVKSQFYIKEGDFLISKRQIVHGACGLVPKELSGSIVSNEYCVLTGKSGFYLPYMEFLSESLYFQQTCFHSSIGVHIEKMIFKLDSWFKWPFNIPPLSEQKRIVKILSTWDEAISVTEKLLTNSQQQKKALMQQLLTGKKRLLDENGVRFSGEWVYLTFDNAFIVANKKSAQVKSSDYLQSGSIPIIDQGQSRIAGYCNNLEVYSDVPVIVFGDHTRCVKWIEFVFCPGADGTQVIKTSKILEPKLGYYLLSNTDIPNLGYSRHMRELKEKDFRLPLDIKEQQKIAAVLSAADAEISTLEKKLACLRDEKKALMQQLLTGKRRVKVDEAVAE
ncbi:TPA: restriction endonuclease subunit S [Klebsiella pneumoniae]|uniref:restriction endonuclease subunit S n=1 Tax=Klebsiella TaxID=570 RepID=UPI000DE5F33B|nr:restriction endonuclease subunit S [Klebsiella pneumoniae]HDU5436526.1 restriction endonuclease subunit S [Klebsiella pneumoniae subsp. pneumoniae]EIW8794540.1 restriction endonuclease subunit S [Klebsiella pneumoniae]EJQ7907691.1 restriction endonuclease subunit S [Klebsiella pneumoniae]EKZ6216864.1 restriction endonuclease subunit S [Klebsiella pneumoniae]ELA2503454.1 restriction endonuclease subunit S [Klebsiella pneumoniae]